MRSCQPRNSYALGCNDKTADALKCSVGFRAHRLRVAAVRHVRPLVLPAHTLQRGPESRPHGERPRTPCQTRFNLIGPRRTASHVRDPPRANRAKITCVPECKACAFNADFTCRVWIMSGLCKHEGRILDAVQRTTLGDACIRTNGKVQQCNKIIKSLSSGHRPQAPPPEAHMTT